VRTGVRPPNIPLPPTKLRSPAELVDVRARPCDRGLDVGDVRRPFVVRCHPVVDGQAHPAPLGQMRHQRVALEQPAAVHPGAAGHEEQHRRGFGRQVLAAPLRPAAGRAGAVADGCPIHAATVLAQLPQRRRAFRRRPFDRQVLGGHDAAQRGFGDGVGAIPSWRFSSALPGLSKDFRRRAEKIGAGGGSPKRPSPSRHPVAQGVSRQRAWEALATVIASM